MLCLIKKGAKMAIINQKKLSPLSYLYDMKHPIKKVIGMVQLLTIF